jgi:8-oxo-dGTP diphosphatase
LAADFIHKENRALTDSRSSPDRPFLGIGAVLIRGDEVLLVERGNEPWKGWWSIPGGVVETGELLRDAVRREMLEETGLEVEPLASIEIFESIGPRVDLGFQFHYVVVDFVCRLIGGTLKAGDDAAAAQWFNRFTLPDPITAGAPGVIEKAFAFMERDTLKS